MQIWWLLTVSTGDKQYYSNVYVIRICTMWLDRNRLLQMCVEVDSTHQVMCYCLFDTSFKW